MANLIDTNILVYCYDPRYPSKQRIATDLIWNGVGNEDLVLSHQVILEFVSAVTRPRPELGGRPLLMPDAAYREAEELRNMLRVLYPDEAVLVTAFRGARQYGISWYDAHLWAYAEVNEIPEILSEDFQHGRHYGSVRVVDPFLAAAGGVHELPAMYDEPSERSHTNT